MSKAHRLIDLVGKRFGRLIVICRVENTKWNHSQWSCLCDCGNTKIIIGDSLRNDLTTSCGCYNKQRISETSKERFPDPISNKPEYILWQQAKTRAKKEHLPFDIEYTDIVIPKFCPVFSNVELKKNVGCPGDDSPSVDKIIPELGYVKGNICVISFKANSIKRDATIDEMRKILDYMEGAFMHQ